MLAHEVHCSLPFAYRRGVARTVGAHILLAYFFFFEIYRVLHQVDPTNREFSMTAAVCVFRCRACCGAAFTGRAAGLGVGQCWRRTLNSGSMGSSASQWTLCDAMAFFLSSGKGALVTSRCKLPPQRLSPRDLVIMLLCRCRAREALLQAHR
jgi:hypothetical protein